MKHNYQKNFFLIIIAKRIEEKPEKED